MPAEAALCVLGPLNVCELAHRASFARRSGFGRGRETSRARRRAAPRPPCARGVLLGNLGEMRARVARKLGKHGRGAVVME